MNLHPLSLFTSTNLILLFHIVPSRNWFADTLRRVKRLYSFVSAEDIEAYYYGDRALSNSCHITFDDGERTVYENALPVLKSMNIPATVFVSPSAVAERRNYWFQELRIIRASIGDTKVKEAICDVAGCSLADVHKYHVLSILKCLKLAGIKNTIDSLKARHDIRIDKRFNISATQLCEMLDSGVFAAGAHTMNHPILSNESDEVAESEIHESLEELSRMTRSRAKYFSHPNGTKLDYGDREAAILRRNGVRLTFTYTMGFFDKKNDPISLPRAAFAISTGDQNPTILPKILLVPVWDTVRTLARLGRTEERQRIEIKRRGLL